MGRIRLGDRIKNGSSQELGKQYADLITDRLAHLAKVMPGWDAQTRQAFAHAEAALVTAQVRGWRMEAAWAAWKDLSDNREYGQLLVDGDFAGIEALAKRLYS